MTSPNKNLIGFWTLTFLVIANMIGAGVFTTSGFTLQALGSPGWVVVAWVVGGVIAWMGALSYGQLAARMPESGGEYLFLSKAAHPMLGFIAGWVSLLAGFSGAIAFAATAFESYALPESIRPSWLPPKTLAIVVVLFGGMVHSLRPRAGALLQNVAVLLKLGFLIVFIVLSMQLLPVEKWQGQPLQNGVSETGGWAFAMAFAGALVWISLSYSGFNAAVYVAGEATDSERTVPRALTLGTLVVMALYVTLNAIFVYAPPPEKIAGMADVAAIAAESIGGMKLSLFFRVIISTALFTSVLSMMMAAPHVYAKMASDGMLPAFLQEKNGKQQGSFQRATIIQVVFSTILILSTTLHSLLGFLGMTLSLSAACTVACLFLPKVRTKPYLHLSSLPPLLFVFATLTAAILQTIHNPKQLYGTVITVAIGATAYLFIARNKRTP